MKHAINSRPLIAFIVIAYAFTWAIIGIGIASAGGNATVDTITPFIMLGAFGPSLAAILVTASTKGRDGVITLLKKLIQWRTNWRVYLATFLLMPLAFVVILLVLRPALIGDTQLGILSFNLIIGTPINALFLWLVEAGPLGEELGWRGFLQPQLKEKHGRWPTIIMVGLIWSFWHGPMFLLADWRNGLPLWQFVLLYPLTIILFTIMFDYLNVWSAGSVLIAVLMHTVINNVLNIMPSRIDMAQTSTLGLFGIILLGLVLACLLFAAVNKAVFAKRMTRKFPSGAETGSDSIVQA